MMVKPTMARQGENKMENEIDWDRATEDNNYVALKSGEEKLLKIVNWTMVKRPSDVTMAPNEYEFKANVLEEDGEECPLNEVGQYKLFTTTSKRLKKALRVVLEERNMSDPVTIKVIKVGENFNTQYNVTVEEITDEKVE